MKTTKSTFVAASFAVFLATLGSAQVKADKPKAPASATALPMPASDRMSMAEFKKLFATSDVVIVDVRANEAYLASHIPGAISIPAFAIDASVAEKLKKMGKPVATYCSCQAEHTAALAAQNLQKMGVPAQAVVGGFNQWVQEKNPVKTGADAK